MHKSTPTPPTKRVPIPKEISSWVSSLKSRLHTYIMEPEHQVMWGILLLAAMLRLVHLDLIELRGEHVGHLQAALTLLGQGQPWDTQALSITPDALPMLHYFLTLPLLLGRDPRLVSAFIALLNVATIGGFYSLVRRHYGLRVSVLASALFSTAPWAVIFSRRISYEGLVIPLSFLLLQGCAMALLDEDPLGWSLATISLGLMLYTTFLSLPLIFAFILLITVYHRRVKWVHLLFGTCLVLLIFTPYLYEQNLSRFADLHLHLQRLLMRTDALSAQRGLRMAAWLHSGHQLSTLVAPSEMVFQLTSSPFLHIAQLEGALFLLALPGVVALAIHAWGHWKIGEEHARYAIPAIFLWGSILAIGLQPGPLELRSLVILYPWGFLAMGLLVDRGVNLCTGQHKGSWWAPGLHLGLYILFLLLILWNVYAITYLYDFLPRHDTKEAYGIPYRFWKQTADLVSRETNEIGENRVWIITQKNDQASTARALSYLTESNLETISLFQNECSSVALPTRRPGVYLFAYSPSRVKDTVQELDGEERGAVLLPSEDRFRLKVVGAKAVQDMLETLQEQNGWTFDDGLQLIGHDWNTQNTTLTTYWTFSALPSIEPREVHHLYVYIQTEAMEGERTTWIARCNGLGLDERHWTEGLVLKQWCELVENIPSGEYELSMEIQQFHAPPDAKVRYIQPYQVHLGTVSVAK